MRWNYRWWFPSHRRLNGARPDRPDDRDRLIATAKLDLDTPSHHSLDRDLPPKNQLGTSSCCGQAMAAATRIAYLEAGADCPELSALFPYYTSRREWSSKVVDRGTMVRDTIKAAVRFGIPPELRWPMVSRKVNRRPSWNAFRTAHKFRGIRSYYSIPRGDLDGVRRAVANGLPVLAWWQVDKPFTESRGPAVIGPCQSPFVGNHAMFVPTYYADGDFGLINSWGLWRFNGRQRVNEEFMAKAINLWAINIRP